MKITPEIIAHLEKLARIELQPDEIETITDQLGRIVDFVEKLQSLDTTGVPPTRLMASGDETHLREDTTRPGLDRDTALSQAPDRHGDFFRVPRVLGKGEE